MPDLGMAELPAEGQLYHTSFTDRGIRKEHNQILRASVIKNTSPHSIQRQDRLLGNWIPRVKTTYISLHDESDGRPEEVWSSACLAGLFAKSLFVFAIDITTMNGSRWKPLRARFFRFEWNIPQNS